MNIHRNCTIITKLSTTKQKHDEKILHGLNKTKNLIMNSNHKTLLLEQNMM
jgi:hypothetical protein